MTELGWEFVQIYGLTETTPVLTMNRMRAEWDDLDPAEQAVMLNRAGAPAVGCTMAVEHHGRGDGPRQHGDGRLLGPARRHRRTRSIDGCFHTGDGGIIDDDNYVTISDRKKDVIITGGENVSSIEVEDAIFQHPEVTEVAVIGIPDEKWGELVTALVVTTPGVDAHRGRRDRVDEAEAGQLQVPEEDRVPRGARTAPPPASSRSSSCAPRSGRARTARSTETGPARANSCTRTTDAVVLVQELADHDTGSRRSGGGGSVGRGRRAGGGRVLWDDREVVAGGRVEQVHLAGVDEQLRVLAARAPGWPSPARRPAACAGPRRRDPVRARRAVRRPRAAPRRGCTRRARCRATRRRRRRP